MKSIKLAHISHHNYFYFTVCVLKIDRLEKVGYQYINIFMCCYGDYGGMKLFMQSITHLAVQTDQM